MDDFTAEFDHFNCPHCDCGLVVQRGETHCRKFRCGALALGNALVQLPPHARKPQVDRWIAEGRLAWGCGNPIRFDGHEATPGQWSD